MRDDLDDRGWIPTSALDAFGAAPLRVQILRFCLQRGVVSTRSVVEAFGIAPNAARFHLTALVRSGAVEARRCRADGRRWRAAWRADREVVQNLIDDLDLYLSISGPKAP